MQIISTKETGVVEPSFRAVRRKFLLENQAQFNYILHYLEGAREWRERSHTGIRNAKEAIDYLQQYRWSSYPDYAGKTNFPSILTTSLFGEALGDYPRALREYLNDAEADLQSMRLE